ncbi:MAG: methylmalonyl Co-A mutase-associated GTPase MeaB [Bacteroidota bacterium]
MSKGSHTPPLRSLRHKKRKNKPIPLNDLFEALGKGEPSALARAITIVESTKPEDIETAQRLIALCLKVNRTSIRIGITGVPGVGKSTFIETFGSHLTTMGKRVAVLAVDPSSKMGKGSILGDKTRMEALAKNPAAFIRPSPSKDTQGGVTQSTRESILLCETAGFEIILVETVGVGQSETLVHSMVDFFLLLQLAGAGDELQGLKRGIMEMADAVVINKADGNNMAAVQNAITEFRNALHLYPPKANQWSPKVMQCSALYNTGIDALWELIETFMEHTKANGHFERNRQEQQKNWFLQTVERELGLRFFNQPLVQQQLEHYLEQVAANRIAPVAAALELLRLDQTTN